MPELTPQQKAQLDKNIKAMLSQGASQEDVISYSRDFRTKYDIAIVEPEVKKKDVLSKAGSGIGGQVGTSEAPLAKDNRGRSLASDKLLGGMAMSGIGASGQAATVVGDIERDLQTPYPENNIDPNDPARSFLNPLRERKRELSTKNMGVESTGQNSGLRTEIISKTKKGEDNSLNEVSRINQTEAAVENELFPDTISAEYWLRKHPSSEDNETSKIAQKVVDDRNAVFISIDNNPGSLKGAAIDYATNQDNQLGKQLKVIRESGADIPHKLEGFLVNQFLQTKAINELSPNNPIRQQAEREKKDLFNFYPELMQQNILSKIAQGREDYGENNAFANFPGVASSDRVMMKLEENGQISPEEKEFYIKTTRPIIGAGAADIPTPGLVESTFKSVGKAISDVPKSVYEATGLRNLLYSKGEILSRDLGEDMAMTPPPKYKGLVKKMANATGNLVGIVLPISGEAKLLQGIGAISKASTANKIATGLTFYHDIEKAERAKNPDNPLMNHLSALLQTGVWMEGSSIFSGLSKGIIRSTAPEFNTVLKALEKGEINNAVAAKKLTDIAANKLFKVAEGSISTSAKISGYTMLNETISGILNNDFNLNQTVAVGLETFEHMMMGVPLLEVAKLPGAKNMTADYLQEIAKNPEAYKERFTNPEQKENFEFLLEVHKSLEGREDLTPEAKKKVQLIEMQKKILEKEIKNLPSKSLTSKEQKDLDLLELEEKMELGEMGNKDFVEEMYDLDYIPKSDRIFLENKETGKFEPNNVGAYLKYLAQQANNLGENWEVHKDTKAPDMSRYPPPLIEAANERWKKEIDKALPKEEVEIDQVREPDMGTEPLKEPSPEVREEVVPIQEKKILGGRKPIGDGKFVRYNPEDVLPLLTEFKPTNTIPVEDYVNKTIPNDASVEAYKYVPTEAINTSEKIDNKDRTKIDKIKEGIKNGDDIPPIVLDFSPVIKNGELYQFGLMDGHHRYIAYKELGVKKIPSAIVTSREHYTFKTNDTDIKTLFKSVENILNETSISSTEAKDKQSNISTEKESSVGEVLNEAGEGTTGGKPPEPPKVEEVKVEGEEELPERRFTKQMLRSDELSEASKGEIAKTLNYVRQTNEMNVKEANEVIDKVGVDEAQHLIMTDGELKPSVRVTLSQIVIKRYNDLADKATDPAEKEFYLDKTIQTASFVTEKLATEAGQSIQAFSMWSRLSPEGQLRAANQDMARQGKEKMARREKDINKIGDKFKKANEETADEVSKTVGEKVKKTESERTKRAKDKVAAAKKKRENIIKKYKGDKGKNLYSSPTGLTKEGIEFVGELVATYVQEGVAKLEILVEKVIAHLKEVSGKVVNDEVKKNVTDIITGRLDKDANTRMTATLKEMEAEVGKIVKEHYTVPEEAKKKLVDKFVEKAGLEKEEAEKLAKEVEAEFDKIATRKKRNILYNEKARFDKINNTLKGDKTPEKKTVADDLIKYTNLGAFENADFAGVISEKFGIGKLTTEQAAKLKILADKIQKAPEGTPKRDATEDLLAYRAKLRGNDLGETAQGVWYANILSGYRTHEKNVISTFFNSIGEIGTEMFKDPKAIPYIMAGYFKGIAHRGRIEAANTLATGRSPIHIKKIETPNVLERKKFVGGVVNPANWFKYVMRMMIAEDVLSFQGLKEARAYQLARREASKMGYNTWSMKGWNKVNEILYHTKERYEAAKEQAIGEGVTGKRETKRRVYELMEESRPQKMTEDAYGFAARGTFNHESEGSLGALTNAVAHTLDAVSVGGVKPLRFIVPFTRIITNVVNNSLDFTPVGLVRGARGVRGFKSFNENQYTKGAYKELSREERQRYIAKASLGILLTGTLQALHQAGVIEITGAGPDDDKKKRQLMQEGWQPYSIKIGGKYYSYQYTPLVFMTGFLGNMNDAAKYNDEDETTLFKRMEVALSRMGGQVADMTWINSASTFLGTLTDKSVRGQEKGIGDAFAGMARGFIPFGGAVTQANQAVQNVFGMPQKQVNNSWQALIQDIPIARNTLNDKINALGEPVTRDIDVFQSKETKDPVWKFLLDKQGWVAPPNRGTVIVFDQKTLQDRPLTNDEWYDFLVKRGKMLKDDITEIIKNGTWVIRDGQVKQVTADDIKTKELNMVLSRLESRATRRTKAEMFGEKEVDEDEKDLQKELKDALEDQFPNDDWR